MPIIADRKLSAEGLRTIRRRTVGSQTVAPSCIGSWSRCTTEVLPCDANVQPGHAGLKDHGPIDPSLPPSLGAAR